MQIADILRELDDHGFEDISSTRKLSIINDVVADVCSREAWPFLEASTDTFAITAGQREPALPSNFRAVLSLVIPSLGAVLTPERLDAITKTNPNALTTTGAPSWYYFVGTTLRLLPVPDANYTATLHYLKHQPTLDASSLEADILIPARHHRAIVLGSLERLFSVQDPTTAGVFNNQFEQRVKQMEQDTWQRQYDRPDRIFVVDEDFDEFIY